MHAVLVRSFRIRICWGGNASEQDKSRLDKNIKKVGEGVGRRQESIDRAYHRLVTNKLRKILADETPIET